MLKADFLLFCFLPFIEVWYYALYNVENLSNPAKYNLKHINVFADHFGLSPKDFLPPAALILKKKEEDKKTEEDKSV